MKIPSIKSVHECRVILFKINIYHSISFFKGWLSDLMSGYTTSFLVLSAVPLLFYFPRLIWNMSRYITYTFSDGNDIVSFPD